MAQAARPMTDTRLPTREELVDRARAMKPALRERLRAAREAATLPAATMQDFKDAGFFRILQPKRWGGYEMDPHVFFDVQLAIAEADMSSAWIDGSTGCRGRWSSPASPLRSSCWSAQGSSSAASEISSRSNRASARRTC